MDMNLQKYLAFVRTAEYGSFTKAEVMRYSQSGISRMIGDLEREWGVSLLERGRSGVRLTSEGTMMLPSARSLCSEYMNLQAAIEGLRGLESGLIRIGTISSTATHWLPPVIKAFQRDYPNIDYELLLGDYRDIEQWITEGRVDFGFLRLPVSGGLETMPLGRDRLLVVMAEDHPLVSLERFPTSALCDYPFILLESGVKAEVSEIFDSRGISPRVRFSTLDDYAVMSMVESGLGIAILPELILRRCPYRIVAKELDVPAFRELGAAFRSYDRLPLAVRRFLEYLDHRNDTAEG